MTAYVCVHGHAYQPPRESPETGEVELQPSAAPYHDWNERITEECYAPMGDAEVHHDDGGPSRHLNLWGAISFDLGPTLGVWMDRHTAGVAASIAAGDREGGGAMAHPWVHAILPLTPPADRATIIRWGVDEYQSRYGRSPTGMWLPETAVDTASLEALVDAGITWTLLAPHQLSTGGDEPRPGVPLVLTLPSGRRITGVPYDGELSHGIAFGSSLDDGVGFAKAMIERAVAASAAADVEHTLTIVAADAETFGHHHRFGEMALAKAVEEWQDSDEVELITVDRFLAQHPAVTAGVVVERTSWSCAHGVERWRSDCGCRFEEVEGRDQRWRRPLRDLLDAVTDVCARRFAESSPADLVDPLEARHDYGVVLAARPEHREEVRRQFLAEHLANGGSAERAWAWMEAERLRLEAWSSCAWFFDSPDRIETQQVLAEARAALARYEELTGDPEDPSGDGLVTWFDRQVAADGLAADDA